MKRKHTNVIIDSNSSKSSFEESDRLKRQFYSSDFSYVSLLNIKNLYLYDYILTLKDKRR